MNTQDVLARFDRHQRRDIDHPGMEKHVLPEIVRFVRPAPGYSQITYSRLDTHDAVAEIQRQIAYFSGRGLSFTWRVYDYDTPPDLRQRLLAHGFQDDDPAALMILDLEQLRLTRGELLEPARADVHPVTAREQIEDMIHVEEQVWGGDFGWMRDRLGSHLDVPGYLSAYVAYVDNQPVCTAWTYFQAGSPFAGLWGGSTVPAYRGRGLYTALLATRIQEAMRRGCEYAYIEATAQSQPIVARHGFAQLATVYGLDWLAQR